MYPIKFNLNRLAEILEKFDISYFFSYTIVFIYLYYASDVINQKLFFNKYMGILSFIMIFSIVVILSRGIRKIGILLRKIYENYIMINEIKEMSYNYYPLENKILELLARENLRKFEIDKLNREFFQQDYEEMQSCIESVEFDSENVLSPAGKRLLDIYNSNTVIFNEQIKNALQNIVNRNIIILKNNTYIFSYSAWHYYKSWIQLTINFMKNKICDLNKTIKRRFREIKKIFLKKNKR